MYEAKKVANLIIDEFDPERYDLTNLKINKIIYFCNGWFLARTGKKLIRNKFEAWKYGPVIRTLYSELKIYGDASIKDKISYLDYMDGIKKHVKYDDVTDHDRVLIKKIASYYICMKASELVELSHAPGGAWDVAFRKSLENGGEWEAITDAEIEREFARRGQFSTLN